MKSPFPGMDPYLESRWSNVHVMMMGALTAALNRNLPPGLEARPEEEIRVESLAGERASGYRGDVAVISPNAQSLIEPIKATGSGATGGSAATLISKPLLIPYTHAPVAIRNVQIVDRSDGSRVITVIEVLSPWNKLAGRLNRHYVRKLRDFESTGISWVEIDLLRSSRQRLTVTWQDLPADKRSDYLIATYRADDEKLSVYPVSLREKLPTILVPLRETDTDMPLDLQAVFERVYAEGPFGSIDYAKPAQPPLTGADAIWFGEYFAKGRG